MVPRVNPGGNTPPKPAVTKRLGAAGLAMMSRGISSTTPRGGARVGLTPPWKLMGRVSPSTTPARRIVGLLMSSTTAVVAWTSATRPTTPPEKTTGAPAGMPWSRPLRITMRCHQPEKSRRATRACSSRWSRSGGRRRSSSRRATSDRSSPFCCTASSKEALTRARSRPASISSVRERARSAQKSCRSRTRDAARVTGAVSSKKLARARVLSAVGSSSQAATISPRVRSGFAWLKRLNGTGGKGPPAGQDHPVRPAGGISRSCSPGRRRCRWPRPTAGRPRRSPADRSSR